MHDFKRARLATSRLRFVWFCLTFLFTAAAAFSADVPKWQRFEAKLESSVDYPNHPQEAALTAVFTSPKGQSRKVYGFWDGGKTWRIRFLPNETGRWSYKTACSDTKNSGLNNQSGEFTCSAAT